jgi:SH3-like domain-containing protein
MTPGPRQALLALATAGWLAIPAAQAQQASPADPDTEAQAAAASEAAPMPAPGRGPVTNMPLPRFVSLKGDEGNARRGPSLSHRIDWVFRHRDMPLMVTAEFGHWRRVEDRDGQGGWIHYSLLSGVRTVMFATDLAELHANPDTRSQVVARAENGVIGRLGECRIDWCRVAAGGEKGWAAKSDIWGVAPHEIRE